MQYAQNTLFNVHAGNVFGNMISSENPAACTTQILLLGIKHQLDFKLISRLHCYAPCTYVELELLKFSLTGNFDECVRNDTDDTDVCVSLIVMPGIWASEYALPLLLLSFNGAGGILYGGLGIFDLSIIATVDVDFSAANLANALDG